MQSKAFLLKTFFLLFIFPFLITCTEISAYQDILRRVTGTVTRVSDGDTIQLATPEQTILKVRLYGIDAPETPKIDIRTGLVNIPGQPYGKESGKALNNKILGRKVTLDIIEVDKYRRMVGIIWLKHRNINLEMVREGYADTYIEYLKPPYRTQFLDAGMEAKSVKRRIWSLPEYERPSDFRRRFRVQGGD
ncbi:MAG: thermonuclease family protein [Smithellaceae bacterium]